MSAACDALNPSNYIIDLITVTCPQDCQSTSSTTGIGLGGDIPTYSKCQYTLGETPLIGWLTDIDELIALQNCIAFELARTLNLYQFDFYNDWINGTLFSYLLKYRKKDNNEEKFCEYDCSDLAAGGVDGNKDGLPDNTCTFNILTDTCVHTNGEKSNKTSAASQIFNEGLIKKYNGEFYYASTTKNAQYRLFATDIVHLGSVHECDWQGIPKLQKYLIPSTYKMAPQSTHYDYSGNVETTAIVYIGNHNTCGLFFSVDCNGLLSNYEQCQNAKHICEIGVNIDEAVYGPNNQLLQATDCHIGQSDINDRTKWFRNVFLQLNTPVLPWISTDSFNPLQTPTLHTNFNTTDVGYYDTFAAGNNDADYLEFRGYGDNQQTYTTDMFDGDGRYAQTNNSYYFYFGLEPGNTALDRLNSRYFPVCDRQIKDNILIQSSSASVSGTTANGSITFSFVGGVFPITYTIVGTVDSNGNPFSYSSNGTTNNSNDILVSNLQAGTYLISGVDFNGITVTDYVTVGVNPALTCSAAYVSSNPTGNTGNGAITIPGVIGGVPPFTYTITKPNFTTQTGILTNPPVIINNLPIDVNNGYTVTISDSSTPPTTCQTTNLMIVGTGTIILHLVGQPTNTHCYDGHNGSVTFTVAGGNQQYSAQIVGVTGPNLDIPYDHIIQASTLTTYSQLPFGNFNIIVTDSNGVTATLNNIVIGYDIPQLSLQTNTTTFNKQCDSYQFRIPFKLTGGLNVGDTIDLYISHNSTTWTSYSSLFSPVLHNPDSSGLDYIYIPSTWPTGNKNIYIKYKVGTPPCESNQIQYTLDSNILPSTNLTVSEGPYQSENMMNNSPFQSNILVKVVNSYYLANMNFNFAAQPYIIHYKIGNNGSWQQDTWPTIAPYYTIQGTRPPLTFSAIPIEVYVTTSDGCISPHFTVNY